MRVDLATNQLNMFFLFYLEEDIIHNIVIGKIYQLVCQRDQCFLRGGHPPNLLTAFVAVSFMQYPLIIST